MTADKERGPLAKPPPLDPKVMRPAEKLVAQYYPGVPLVPTMSTGATDGNGTHGLNEHEAVRAVYGGRDLLTELVKAYADTD